MSSNGSLRVSDAVKERSTLLEPQKGHLSVYQIPLKNDQVNIKGSWHYSLGEESTKPNRTIVVLGASRSGKTTLINGMINYITGVEWEDSYRFKLVDEGQSKSQAHSQTEVNVYKLNHQEGFNIDHSLTIIDTPGFGDLRALERDQETIEQLGNLFAAELGVGELHAVCFVIQSFVVRLTLTQKFMLDFVLSVFGKDVADSVRVLVTFADNQVPPVLEAISASGVPCPKTEDGQPVHFIFNDSALFVDNKSPVANGTGGDDDDDADQVHMFNVMFWNQERKNMKTFFDALSEAETRSLTLTKEVLREREQLEDSAGRLVKQVEMRAAGSQDSAEVVTLTEKAARCLGRLKEIALKPSPLLSPEYIDVLIEGEKSEAHPGWDGRVQSLMAARQKAELMSKVEKGENLLQ